MRRTLLVAVLLALPRAASAQTSRGDSLLASGDTTGAITAYEAAVQLHDDDAEAHYKAGVLYLSRFMLDTARQAQARRQAEHHFETALRFRKDSAKYYLAMADILRAHSDMFARAKISGLLDSALAIARRHGGPFLAEVEYRAGLLWWERFEQRSHSYLFKEDAFTFDAVQGMGDWNYLQTFLQRFVKATPGDPGGTERREAEIHLRAALAANPRHIDSAGLLAVLMCNEKRWEEAVALGRRLVRAAPDSGRAWAILAMALTRQNSWAEAQADFDSALVKMTSRQAAPYFNLGPLLKLADQVRWKTMTPGQRSQLYASYWAVSQPLYLTTLNEPRTEFFARLTEVQHRWSEPMRGIEGYETDRGKIYIRYGPPDVWATLGRGAASSMQTLANGESVTDPLGALEAERNTVLWVYNQSQLRFLFSVTPGFSRAVLANEFPDYFRQVQTVMPVRFDNVPAVHLLDTVLVQFAQFRGDSAHTDLAVYSFTPLGRMVMGTAKVELPFQAAAIVKDGLLRDVLRSRQDGTVMGGDSLQIEHRMWRLSLTPQAYYLRIENRLPSLDRGARSSSALQIYSFGGDSLSMSDVIVAENVAPKDSAATRWSDFFVQPSAGRILPGSPLALLWELYNLAPDSTGSVRYHVDLRIDVKEVERRGFFARILGGVGDAVGLSARGDDQVTLAFDRHVPARATGEYVDYLKVDLQNAPEATYGIHLTITDLVNHRVVQKLRQVMVTKTALTR